MKEQKGITIATLIITIIVMLILAGVAIVMAISDEGILKQTENAQKKQKAGEELEKVKIAVSQASLTSGGELITEYSLIEALEENFVAGEYYLNNSGEYFKLTIKAPGRKYHIYPNGKVEGPIGGESVALGNATVGIKVDVNSTIDGKVYSSTNPLIPAGFTAINTSTSKWDAEGGPEVDKGVVIRDESGNEFVWVPVSEDVSTTKYNSVKGYPEPNIVRRCLRKRL